MSKEKEMTEKEKAAYEQGARDYTGKVIPFIDLFKIFPELEESKGCRRYFRRLTRFYTGAIAIIEHTGGALDASKARIFCIKPEKDLKNINDLEIFKDLENINDLKLFSAYIEKETGKIIIEK